MQLEEKTKNKKTVHLIKTHSNELHSQETTKRMPQLKPMCGHYCESFTCRDGLEIFGWIVYSIQKVWNFQL